jgi:hypothetical protein
MANDFVGRYGATLRRLDALNRGGLSQPAQQAPAGAFGSGPPQGPAPQVGAFSALPAGAPAASAQPQDQDHPPMSAQQLWKDMPDEFKGQIEKQITDSGLDVDHTFAAKVDQGEIDPPKKEMTRQEKLGYLAEVALRTMSNLSRPGTQSISDFADAKLATDARRGAIETAETDRRRKQAETRRIEGRQDQADQRRTALDLTDRELTREGIAAEGTANRQNALDIAKMQEGSRSADRKSERDKPGPVLTDQETGNAYRLNADGSTTPIEKEVEEEVPGQRGNPAWKRKVKKPLKGGVKQGFNQIDEDTLVREQGRAASDMAKDTTLMRQLKKDLADGKISNIDDEIDRRAREKVMRRLSTARGLTPPPAAPQKKNFFDEDE